MNVNPTKWNNPSFLYSIKHGRKPFPGLIYGRNVVLKEFRDWMNIIIY